MSHGFSVDDCCLVLLCHLFSGACVSSQPSSRDCTACDMFSRGFESAAEMSFGAFSILSSATPSQRSNDELLHLLEDLEISTDFRAKNLQPQILRELQKTSEIFSFIAISKAMTDFPNKKQKPSKGRTKFDSVR